MQTHEKVPLDGFTDNDLVEFRMGLHRPLELIRLMAGPALSKKIDFNPESLPPATEVA